MRRGAATSLFYFMSVDAFKNLAWSPDVEGHAKFSETDPVVQRFSSKPTGSSNQGGYVAIGMKNKGFSYGFEKTINTSGESVKDWYTTDSRKRMSKFSEGFLDENFNIKGGTYLYIGTKGVLVEGTILADTLVRLKGNYSVSTGLPASDVPFTLSGADHFMCVVNIIGDQPLKATSTGFILMRMERSKSYIQDFNKLSYSSGSEQRISDTLSYKLTYTSSQPEKSVPLNPDDFSNQAQSREYNYTNYLNSESSSPVEEGRQGCYFIIKGIRNGREEDHGYNNLLIPQLIFEMTTVDEDESFNILENPSNPIETFGQTNYKCGYVRRLGDVAPPLAEKLDDFDKNKYIPTKRPQEVGMLSAIYNLDFQTYAEDILTSYYQRF